MSNLKCIVSGCRLDANYIYNGQSLCNEHFREVTGRVLLVGANPTTKEDKS